MIKLRKNLTDLRVLVLLVSILFSCANQDKIKLKPIVYQAGNTIFFELKNIKNKETICNIETNPESTLIKNVLIKNSLVKTEDSYWFLNAFSGDGEYFTVRLNIIEDCKLNSIDSEISYINEYNNEKEIILSFQKKLSKINAINKKEISDFWLKFIHEEKYKWESIENQE